MPDHSERDPIDIIADELATELRRGETADVEKFIRRYPDQEKRIRDLFPTLLALATAAEAETAEPGTPPDDSSPQGMPEQLGPYRLVREIGRGGMGTVYEAEQSGLDRRVALKVLPDVTHTDAMRLERFQREARAGGSLQHPHIVSVIEVGESDGLHYFTMQYIDGDSLDRIIAASRSGGSEKKTAAMSSADTAMRHLLTRNLTSVDESTGSGDSSASANANPLTNRALFHRNAAVLMIQAARALAHAHANDILHRDVKPANLLLDTNGHLWITDFGLAKTADQPELTETGDVVGTIRYMAPERFNGWADPRSDVYSLGLTLYELLTGRPAFTERDRGRLIRRILNEAPPSPRKVKRDIPADLETIVLKATAKEPAARYASASAMAEDLQRYLDGRPILAKRATVRHRLWMWSKRNPWIAGLTVMVGILLVAVAVVSTTAAFRIDEERNEALASAEEARIAEGKALDAESEARAAEKATGEALIRANEHLFQSALSQARLALSIPHQGQRTRTLATIARVDKKSLSARQILLLRENAISCLSLDDIVEDFRRPRDANQSFSPSFDAQVDRYAHQDLANNEIVIRNLKDGRVVKRLKGIPARVRRNMAGIRFSPDGRWLVAQFLLGIHVVWQTDRAQPHQVIKLAGNRPASRGAFDFSFDSRLLAIAHGRGSVAVYDLKVKQRIHNIDSTESISDLRFHPTKSRLALFRRSRVEVYDAVTGERLTVSNERPRLSVYDGRELAAVSNERGKGLSAYFAIPRLLGRTSRLQSQPRGLLIAAYSPKGTQWWCPYRGSLLLTTPDHAAFGNRGRRVALSGRTWVGRGTVEGGREYRVLGRSRSAIGLCTDIDTTADSGFLISTPPRGSPARFIRKHFRAESPVAGSDYLVYWNLKDNRKVLLSAGRNSTGEPSTKSDWRTVTTRLAHDGATMYSCDWRFPFRIGEWTGRLVRQAVMQKDGKLHLGPASPIVTSLTSQPGVLPIGVESLSDDVLLITYLKRDASRRSVEQHWLFWNPRTGKPAVPGLKASMGVQRSGTCAVSWKHRVAAVLSSDSAANIHDLRSGRLIHTIHSRERIQHVRWSPDGSRLAIGTMQSYEVRSRLRWTSRFRIPISRENPPLDSSIAFSPGGSWIAVVTSARSIALCESSTGHRLCRFEIQHNRQLVSITFSRDNRYLIASTDDGLVHVWDIPLIRKGLRSVGLDWADPPSSR